MSHASSLNLVDAETLAPMLGVKPKTLYDWAQNKRIPHYKLGKLVRFNLDEITKWVQSCGVAEKNNYQKRDVLAN